MKQLIHICTIDYVQLMQRSATEPINLELGYAARCNYLAQWLGQFNVTCQCNNVLILILMVLGHLTHSLILSGNFTVCELEAVAIQFHALH